jgi:hypothetical protein
LVSIAHSTLQGVYSDGTPTYLPSPTPLSEPITVRGMVINNPGDMLNYSTAASPQWQVFFQATEPGDFGGTALYMRKSTPWLGQNYTDGEWASEMTRLNFPGGVTSPLQRGDMIEVTAKAPGMFYGGKYNINEKHLTDAAYDFSIAILSRGNPLVAAAISLADLKLPDNSFQFDQTRATGNEHYQGSLVHLDNLLLDSGTWALNGTVMVRQGDLTFPMLLGLDPGLLSANPGTSSFSLTAILDQEDSAAPYTNNYRLWLTNASDLSSVPEPSSFLLLALGGVGQCVWFLRRKFRGLA